jgi:hypothetical protein
MDPLTMPHPSRLSSAELPVLGGPKRSLLIDGANHFRSIQCSALIKLDYNLTSTSWPSSSGLKGRRKTYLTILKRAWSAHSKMVR